LGRGLRVYALGPAWTCKAQGKNVEKIASVLVCLGSFNLIYRDKKLVFYIQKSGSE
jgi:hypothetical protein